MMNQKRKRRGFFFPKSKRSKKQSKKPQTSSTKHPRSCFSMHSHPVIFSIMCRCSYSVKKDHPNKPVEAPIEPDIWHQNAASPREATLITKYDYNGKSEAAAAPSTPSKIKRGKLKKRVTIGSNQTSVVVGGDEAEWPASSDEDYIVFCFEEDGEFKVVMEESSRSSDFLEHGNSDVSPTPHNLKVEEERFYFSPRLQSDGIRSATRFKQEVDEERSRGRVDVEKECKDMDELKSRGPFDDDDQQQEVESEEDVEFRDTSIECVHGSTESPGSIQSDWEQLLQVTESSGCDEPDWEQLLIVDEETGVSSPSSRPQDGQTSSEEIDSASPSTKTMVDDEESVYLSSESQQEESQDSDEHSNNDEQSGGGSAETSDTNRSEIIEEEQSEASEHTAGKSAQTSYTSISEIIEEEPFEESTRLSVVSSKCSEDSDRISRSSFEFPLLPWEWNGSPDIWPKSETPTSISFRKQKPNKMCLRLCRF